MTNIQNIHQFNEKYSPSSWKAGKPTFDYRGQVSLETAKVVGKNNVLQEVWKQIGDGGAFERDLPLPPWEVKTSLKFWKEREAKIQTVEEISLWAFVAIVITTIALVAGGFFFTPLWVASAVSLVISGIPLYNFNNYGCAASQVAQELHNWSLLHNDYQNISNPLLEERRIGAKAAELTSFEPVLKNRNSFHKEELHRLYMTWTQTFWKKAAGGLIVPERFFTSHPILYKTEFFPDSLTSYDLQQFTALEKRYKEAEANCSSSVDTENYAAMHFREAAQKDHSIQIGVVRQSYIVQIQEVETAKSAAKAAWNKEHPFIPFPQNLNQTFDIQIAAIRTAQEKAEKPYIQALEQKLASITSSSNQRTDGFRAQFETTKAQIQKEIISWSTETAS